MRGGEVNFQHVKRSIEDRIHRRCCPLRPVGRGQLSPLSRFIGPHKDTVGMESVEVDRLEDDLGHHPLILESNAGESGCEQTA